MSRSANDRRRKQVEDRYFGYEDSQDSNRKSRQKKKSERLSLDAGVNFWKRPNVSRHDIDEFYED